MPVSKNSPLFLSDGTPVTFVKTTSRGRIQVRIPAGHALASDPLRIFDPRTGAHYKNATDLTLTNTAPTAAATPAPVSARVDTNAPMFLSDGTPVTLSKVTRRGRVQVVLPTNHADAAGQGNGLLYEVATGERYKGRSAIFLTNTAGLSAVVAPADAVAAAPVSDDATYGIATADGSLLDTGFDTFDAAEAAAFGYLNADSRSVNIVKTSTSVVGVVGFSTTRA